LTDALVTSASLHVLAIKVAQTLSLIADKLIAREILGWCIAAEAAIRAT
jgi:hypothetical protein